MGVSMADIRGIMEQAADTFSDAVVQVCQTYTLGGQSQSAIYSGGVKGALTANQRVSIAGNATTETFSVVLSTIPDGATEPPPVLITEGTRVTLRKDDNDAGKAYSVLTRQADPLGATQTIILGPKHG